MKQAIEELIGKKVVHKGRPASVIGVNRSEAGEFYVIEEHDERGEPLAQFVAPAMTINLVFAGSPPVDWRLPNLETLPRLEPGTKVRAVFNGTIQEGTILKSFDDDRGYRVKITGTSFTIPVLNEAIIPATL